MSHMSHDGLTDSERIRLLALQSTNGGLGTAERVEQAEKFAAFLFGPAAEPVQLKPPTAE